MRSFLGVRVAIGSVKHLLQCSPLARGNQALQCGCAGGGGPIPARAGQPRWHAPARPAPTAYPRSRGATGVVERHFRKRTGLSPLARGNRDPGHICRRVLGPIPARAGQPCRPPPSGELARAYPRSRGATASSEPVRSYSSGLSPLARGNLHGRPRRGNRAGPIPARAGQPHAGEPSPSAPRAYPRSRGATRYFLNVASCSPGLSPLARGNQAHGLPFFTLQGPIPARAGQPASRGRLRPVGTAYPRSRGATGGGEPRHHCGQGLSPLARGNRCPLALPVVLPGPIPARAGQPGFGPACRAARRAYPRSRGATKSMSKRTWRVSGLSPLARGNRVALLRLCAFVRPIPARAGQPDADALDRRWNGAYPRSRGATVQGLRLFWGHYGLSPLARGNLGLQAAEHCRGGPIPARAGQPLHQTT